MINKEKLIAKIKWLKIEKCKENLPFHALYYDGYEAACDKIIAYLNSLPAEQQSERLGDEIDHFRCSDIFALAKRAGEEVTATAQHFADWQKEQMMKSAVDALVDEDTENVGKKTLLLIGKQRNTLNTRLSNCEYGETVKLVIIKEGEQ